MNAYNRDRDDILKQGKSHGVSLVMLFFTANDTA